MRRWLPEGRRLPEQVWTTRHRAITALAVVQGAALVVFGVARGLGVLHSFGEATIIWAPLMLAFDRNRSREARAMATSAGLLLASVILVHMSGGVTEAHFHFFVMIGVVALYQEWRPYLVAVAVVVLHHGVLGTIDPDGVFGTSAARTSPWTWAAIHGGFVLAASLASLIAWRLNEEQSLQDPLTGVGNRTRFAETLDRRWAEPGRSVSMLFIDLDHFKAINDTRGHQVGDAVLRAVATRLSTCARRGDVVARFGGDEFAVLVDGDSRTAEIVAARFEQALHAPFDIEGQQITIQASIGVADSAMTDTPGADDLLRNADQAMLQAKGFGKARTVVFDDELGAELRARGRLQFDLVGALARDEFSLVHQPLVDLDDRSFIGCEALLRWNHPLRGTVSPDVFIRLAEETSLIVPLGEWVIRRALHDASALREIDGFTVSVNLSPQQLLDDGLLAAVTTALGASRWPAGRLVLEITETVVITDLARATRRLDELRALGVKIAIDDFGTGYSSLSYLRDLPIDVLKIDRSFVASLAEDPRSLTVLQGIISMATGLGIGVIAEGVEDEAQASILRGLGCRVGQGHLFAHPMTIAELSSRRLPSARPSPITTR